MEVLINGKKESLEDGMDILGLLNKKKIRPEMVAIELNDQVIHRNQYPEITLKDSDRLEFIYYMGGGKC